jgi:uncharacterized protein with PQ loop repeat
MATTSLPVLAGIASTVIFAASALPMLVKAWRTRDLASYSRGNIVLSNVGNAVHSIYVFSMPVGPIWLLHAFYLVSSALMLLWSVRYRAKRGIATMGQGAVGMGTVTVQQRSTGLYQESGLARDLLKRTDNGPPTTRIARFVS